MKNYFFLRHFETDFNRGHRLSGCEMDIPVLETHPIFCSATIDVVFSSSARRCQQTLEAFLTSQSVQAVFYSDLLVERNLGLLQGKIRSVAIEEYPDIFEETKLNVFATPPNGETYADFLQRAKEAKKWVDQNSNGFCNILICSHNQFLKMLFFLLNQKPLSKLEWNNLTFPFGEIVPIGLCP